MESPPHKLNVGRDEDRISALTDDLLLEILERLDLRQAVRAGALSTRWRHLPHRLSRLHHNVGQFRRATMLEGMDAFTGAARGLLAERECDCNRSRAIKSLSLGLFLSAPHLSSIGRAVEDVVSRGETKHLYFFICSPRENTTASQVAKFGQQFMSFYRDYQVVFRWLTRLTLKGVGFGHSEVTDLINTCDRLKHLSLKCCELLDLESTTLKIDIPCSGLQELEIIHFGCTLIDLISAPKLSKVKCHWYIENPPVRFGYVPKLREVSLVCLANAWQVPFLLSDCLSRSATNLSKLHLNFCHHMIWIQLEHSKQLTAIFRNLADVSLSGIFPECDLSWTLFILEAAPALQKLTLSRTRHTCAIEHGSNSEKTNVLWEPSKDLKHMNLKMLMIDGFEEEDKVTDYIRLVVERAVGLKRVELRGEDPCKKCDAIDPRRSQVDEARRHRIKEWLAHGSSSSTEIIMC